MFREKQGSFNENSDYKENVSNSMKAPEKIQQGRITRIEILQNLKFTGCTLNASEIGETIV